MLASNNGHKPSGFSGTKKLLKNEKKSFLHYKEWCTLSYTYKYMHILLKVCKLWKDPTDKHFENKNTFSRIINQI